MYLKKTIIEAMIILEQKYLLFVISIIRPIRSHSRANPIFSYCTSASIKSCRMEFGMSHLFPSFLAAFGQALRWSHCQYFHRRQYYFHSIFLVDAQNATQILTQDPCVSYLSRIGCSAIVDLCQQNHCRTSTNYCAQSPANSCSSRPCLLQSYASSIL